LIHHINGKVTGYCYTFSLKTTNLVGLTSDFYVINFAGVVNHHVCLIISEYCSSRQLSVISDAGTGVKISQVHNAQQHRWRRICAPAVGASLRWVIFIPVLSRCNSANVLSFTLIFSFSHGKNFNSLPVSKIFDIQLPWYHTRREHLLWVPKECGHLFLSTQGSAL